ncbi:MAG: hypothetical protein IJ272_01950 [Clostridia bacterium]|nr:hypothetical protein [Clostridia bacterium]
MKKGISLMVVVITVVVLTILTGVIVINSSSVVGNTGKSQLQLDIAQLESLMNTYKIRKSGNIPFETVEFNTADLSSAELEQFAGETIVNNTIELYVIDLYEIDAEAVNYGNLQNGSTDRYLYSINTGKVYYEKGLETEEGTYYYVVDGE